MEYKVGDNVKVINTKVPYRENGSEAKILEINDKGDGISEDNNRRYEIKLIFIDDNVIAFYYPGDLEANPLQETINRVY